MKALVAVLLLAAGPAIAQQKSAPKAAATPKAPAEMTVTKAAELRAANAELTVAIQAQEIARRAFEDAVKAAAKAREERDAILRGHAIEPADYERGAIRVSREGKIYRGDGK